MNKKLSFPILIICIIVFSILYRVLPWRIPGFAPHIAIILLAGFYIKDKKMSLLISFLSLFLSDVFYEVFYQLGWSSIYGFYGWSQAINYLLLLSLIGFSWYFKTTKLSSLMKSSILAPTFYFLISNTQVWLSGGGFARPKTFFGFIWALEDGIPFYITSLCGTIFFMGIFYATILFVYKQLAVENK